MRYALLLATSAIILSGCGGSGTGNAVVPIASSGFAEPNRDTNVPVTLTVDSLKRVVGTPTGTASFATQDIEVTADGEGFTAVVIEGKTYPLIPEPGDPGDYIFEDADRFISVELFLSETSVGGIEVFSLSDTEGLNRGNVVIGFDTNPATVEMVEGNAVFGGAMIGTLTNAQNTAFVDGDFDLTVNFDNAKVDGTATIFNPGTSVPALEVETFTFKLEQSDLSGNGFAGDVTLQSGDVNGTLVSGAYDGRLFGTEAESIGGHISGQVDANGTDTDTFIEAIFVGAIAPSFDD